MSFTLEVSVAKSKFPKIPHRLRSFLTPPMTAAFHLNIELGAGLII